MPYKLGLSGPEMPFNLFHKKKTEEQQAPAVPPHEAQPITEPETQTESPVQSPQEASSVTAAPIEESAPSMPIGETKPEASVEPAVELPQPSLESQPAPEPVAEQQNEMSSEAPSKTYLKALPLKDLADLENVKKEVQNGNIIILKITPLAQKSIEDVKSAVNDLFQFAESIGGDIARLGEERVVICPKTVRIWREKTPKPVVNEPLPTAA
jgi:SepF-like predicted cell division protein (DUF552 family)